MRAVSVMTPLIAAMLGLTCTTDSLARDRVLQVVGPWEITGIDPVRAGYVFGRMGVAETLVTVDGDGNPIPALAESWSVSDDRLVWRFALRPAARSSRTTRTPTCSWTASGRSRWTSPVAAPASRPS